ncbi:Uncharacterised protein [Mycobacterium tuberculosis]|nr:Uncharacterised protein [Mycobacterium tuberculosis]
MAEQPDGGSTGPADPTGSADGSGTESAGTAVAAVAEEQSADPAGTTGKAGRPGPADATVAAVADQPCIPTGAAGLADPAVAAVAAVAVQQPAGPAGLSRRAIGAITDQRAAEQRLKRPVEHVQRGGVRRLGTGIGPRAGGHGMHKLLVKQRRLRTQCLIGLGVRAEQIRNSRRHLIGARGQHPHRGPAAAAFAAPIADPMPAKSDAAATTTSGAATTNDMTRSSRDRVRSPSGYSVLTSRHHVRRSGQLIRNDCQRQQPPITLGVPSDTDPCVSQRCVPSRMVPTRSSTTSSSATIPTTEPLSAVTKARWLLMRRIRDRASASGNDWGTRGSGRTTARSITVCGLSPRVSTSLMCRYPMNLPPRSTTGKRD